MEGNRFGHGIQWRGDPLIEAGRHGELFVPYFFEGFSGQIRAGQTLIDFGCGQGKAAREFLAKGLNVTLVDISPYSLDQGIRNMLPLHAHQLNFVQACLWKLPGELKSAYWVYCCNVLEHIPEGMIDGVLCDIGARMRFGGYFSIALKGEMVTRKSRDWWEQRLEKEMSISGEDAFSNDLYFNCRVTKKHTATAQKA